MWVKNVKMAIAYWVGWFVCICFVFYFNTIDEYRNAEKAKAVVVDKLIATSRRGWYYYPQFQVEYKDSSWFFAQRRKTYFSSWDIGEKATAIFPAGQPDKAEVYLFPNYWISVSTLFFGFMIALFLFIIPIFFRWYTEFNKRRERMG